MHLRDLPVLVDIAIGMAGFTLMVIAFALAAGRGGWRHVMQPDPLQRWTLPRRLMFAGAALGVAFGVMLFILAVLPGGLPWRK